MKRMELLAKKSSSDKFQTQSLKQDRLANKYDALAEDWGFQIIGMGGIKRFQRKKVCRLLERGETRSWVATEDLPDDVRGESHGHKRRCQIESPTGSKRFAVDWSDTLASKHVVLDMGSSSWPMQAELYSNNKGCLGGTYDADPPHRRHRHHINALEWSGNASACAEVHLALVTGAAPYGRSAFFGALKDGAGEFFHNFTWRECPLFDVMYPRLSHVMHRGKLNSAFGSDGDKADTWIWCKRSPLLSKRLSTSKEGRWYEVITRALQAMPHWGGGPELVGQYLSTVSGWETKYVCDDVDGDDDGGIPEPTVDEQRVAATGVATARFLVSNRDPKLGPLFSHVPLLTLYLASAPYFPLLIPLGTSPLLKDSKLKLRHRWLDG